MRKIGVIVGALMGLALAEAKMVSFSEVKTYSETYSVVSADPRKKRSRAKLAQQYFGRGGKCRRWSRFCER
ncbi:MAG: hypothetical protein NZ958_05340 [Bacteroidia bacterium]|nr:hypothetical protein [Bacteroidia bacterium]MDW8088993.1 hypothetical protein [Bacteroidia bacterium]